MFFCSNYVCVRVLIIPVTNKHAQLRQASRCGHGPAQTIYGYLMKSWSIYNNLKATPLIGGAEESHLQQIILGFWTNHEHIKMQFHSVPPTATLAYFLKEDDWPKGKKLNGPIELFFGTPN